MQRMKQFLMAMALVGLVAPVMAADEAAPAQSAGELKAIDVQLPKPMFVGTPTDIKSDNLEKPLGKPRPPFMAPKDVTKVSLKADVTGSDDAPIIGELAMITDDDREGSDGSFVELAPGPQYIQIDLKQPTEIFAILIWHYHAQARVYRDVVVKVADDPDFVTNVQTVFNNDHDNSSGLGIGKDKEYIETNEGKLIDAKGVKARYVRLYSNGNTANEMNHYIEVEVFGRPAK